MLVLMYASQPNAFSHVTGPAKPDLVFSQNSGRDPNIHPKIL